MIGGEPALPRARCKRHLCQIAIGYAVWRHTPMSTNGKDEAPAGSDEGQQRPANAEGRVPVEVASGRIAPMSSDADVAAFVRRLQQLGPSKATQGGRLIFAMDATMSRQPTWDMALALQADMFHAVSVVGGLDVQLVYFRGAGMSGIKMGVGPGRLGRLDDARCLCRGLYANSQSVEPCPQGSGNAADRCPHLRWRLHGRRRR